jgi:hypothetical protein
MDAIMGQYKTTTIARDMLGATSNAMMSRAFFNPQADLAKKGIFYPAGALGASADDIIQLESQLRMPSANKNSKMLQLGARRPQGAQPATSGISRVSIDPVYSFK